MEIVMSLLVLVLLALNLTLEYIRLEHLSEDILKPMAGELDELEEEIYKLKSKVDHLTENFDDGK